MVKTNKPLKYPYLVTGENCTDQTLQYNFSKRHLTDQALTSFQQPSFFWLFSDFYHGTRVTNNIH